MELEGEDDDLGPFKLTLGAEASGRRVNGVNYEFDPGDLLFMVRYENNKGTNYAGIRNDDEKLTLSIDWEARTFEFDVNLVGPVIELDVEGSGDVTQTPPFAVIGTDSKLECTGPDGVFEVLDASPSFDLEADPWTADWVVDGTRLSSSGTQLGLGAHEVGLVVVDEVHRSSGSKAAVISVEDTTAPDLTCPAPATAECSVTGGAQDSDAEVQAFLDGASSADVCDLSPSLANDVQSFLDLGPNTVTFSSEDDYSNESTCDAVLTVIDTVAPVVACPEDLQIECNAFGGVSADDPAVSGFFAGASASDVCDASLVVLNDAPGFFGVGSTSVTFQTADDSGNIGACTATVIVVDTTPPELSVSSSPDVLWPPNHKMETVSVDFEVSDICDPDPTVHLVTATSDEPDNGQGDGNTVNDIQGATLGTEDVSVLLRRERSGSGDGRTYTLEYTATDDSENSTSAATTVDVPHSKPK